MPEKDEEMETLTLEEVAQYLQKDIETVRRNVRAGKIPGGIKVGGSWRVHKETFRRFLRGEIPRKE
ncbi:MAG: helix-turn-helix domain-containing protein [Ktedonobacteraceae bacterium]